MYIYTHTYACTHTLEQAYMHTLIHALINTDIHTYIQLTNCPSPLTDGLRLHTCTYTYINTCMDTAPVLPFPTSINTYIYTYIHTYIHTYSSRTALPHFHKYIHIHIHTYIHTYIQLPNCPSPLPDGLRVSRHDGIVFAVNYAGTCVFV
jgi:hypothetical protein